MSEQYKVIFDLGFSIVANDERGETLRPSEIRYAIIERAMSIPDNKIQKAVNFCGSYSFDKALGIAVIEESNNE